MFVNKLLIILVLISTFAYGNEEAQICYFSLNNEKEFKVMENVVNRINQFSQSKIKIHEYQLNLSNPEESFIHMAKEAKCDGLVISGHHTGSFGGKRADGSLSVDFLEKLSCKPEFKDFFANIKALWLQGCRTMGVSKDATIEPEELSADFHTIRVGEELDQDDLQQSILDLNIEFSATLDLNNPLSSRYLRVFPRASVFGWTATAPGINAKSEYSIPFHMAHISRLSGGPFINPTEIKDPETATKFASIILNVLTSNHSTKTESCSISPELMKKAWHDHGRKDYTGTDLTFANSDLIAELPLILNKDESLKMAREIECIISLGVDVKELTQIIKKVLDDPIVLGYSINRISELLKRYKENDLTSYSIISDLLKKSDKFQYFLMEKISSDRTGILNKIDYLALIKEIYTDLNTTSIEKKLNDSFVQLVLKSDSDLIEVFDFQYTIAQSLGKHGLLNKESIEKIVKEISENRGPSSALSISSDIIKYLKVTIKEKEKLFKMILSTVKKDDLILRTIVKNIGEMEQLTDNALTIIDDILIDKSLESNVLPIVSNTILKSKINEDVKIKYLEKLFKSDKIDSDSLTMIMINIFSNDVSSSKKLYFLRKFLKFKSLNFINLNEFTYYLSDLNKPISDVAKVVDLLLGHSKIDDATLASIAIIIGNNNQEIKNSLSLLKQIYKHRRRSSELLSGVVFGILSERNQNKETINLIYKIINSPNSDILVYRTICNFMSDSDNQIKFPIDILYKILKKKNIDLETIEMLSNTIVNYKGEDKEVLNQLIKKIIKHPYANTFSLTQLSIFAVKNQIKDHEKILQDILDLDLLTKEELKSIKEALSAITNKSISLEKINSQIDELILQ